MLSMIGQRVLPVLDILAALAVLIGLLPATGALPGIADSAFPFANALWLSEGLEARSSFSQQVRGYSSGRPLAFSMPSGSLR